MIRFILNYLGVFFILLSILSFFNIIYSYYFNLYLNINTYFYTLLISGVIGLSSLIIKKNTFKINIYSKIITVILGYFLLPLIISIPFYFSIYNLSFLNCYFESISGFTSTGFTVFENIKHPYFYYIPDREKDGYGATKKLFKKIITKKPKLIIMVDCGSTSYEAIDYLNQKNIKSIIIDHHEINKPYPKCDALINPKKK